MIYIFSFLNIARFFLFNLTTPRKIVNDRKNVKCILYIIIIASR